MDSGRTNARYSEEQPNNEKKWKRTCCHGLLFDPCPTPTPIHNTWQARDQENPKECWNNLQTTRKMQNVAFAAIAGMSVSLVLPWTPTSFFLFSFRRHVLVWVGLAEGQTTTTTSQSLVGRFIRFYQWTMQMHILEIRQPKRWSDNDDNNNNASLATDDNDERVPACLPAKQTNHPLVVVVTALPTNEKQNNSLSPESLRVWSGEVPDLLSRRVERTKYGCVRSIPSFSACLPACLPSELSFLACLLACRGGSVTRQRNKRSTQWRGQQQQQQRILWRRTNQTPALFESFLACCCCCLVSNKRTNDPNTTVLSRVKPCRSVYCFYRGEILENSESVAPSCQAQYLAGYPLNVYHCFDVWWWNQIFGETFWHEKVMWWRLHSWIIDSSSSVTFEHA